MLEVPTGRYAADHVFITLAGEILQGLATVGSTLPAERELSERFVASKLIVRAAVHRLAEAGLVTTRQGGATKVTDPMESRSLKVIELYYQLAPTHLATSGITRDVLEKQFTQGISLLNVFARRALPEAKRGLPLLVSRAIAESDDFEESFWRAIAEGGGNRVLMIETRWLYDTLRVRPKGAMKKSDRLQFYPELAKRLCDEEDAVAFYVARLSPAIDALFESTARAAKQPSRRAAR